MTSGKKLYRDIELDNAQQQFVATDSAGMKSITQFIGGYGTAIACSVILLASVYLLIYNVLSISLAKDMNNFGLLMVVGLTRKQLKKMVFRQNIIILLSGIMGGAFLSTLVGIFVFQDCLKIYFEAVWEIGSADGILPTVFNWCGSCFRSDAAVCK